MLEETRIALIVYICALLPIYLLVFKFKSHPEIMWFRSIYIFSFVKCSLGWVLWFTYALVGGFPVDMRRSELLNTIIPININWLVNSLADAGAICIGGILLIKLRSNNNDVFKKWNWLSFAYLGAFTIGQNLFVEMFLYSDQLSIDKPLSWAPFSPFGSFFNPVLMQFGERSILLQTQLPWLIMTPALYAYSIFTFKRLHRHTNL